MIIEELYKNLAVYFVIVFGIAFFISPTATKVFRSLKFIDLPKFLRADNDQTSARRIHFKTYVRSGGIIVLISILFGIFMWGMGIPHIYPILAAIGVLTIGSLLDDRYDIPGKYQFLIQFIVCAIVVGGGVNILQVDKGFPGVISLSLVTFKIIGDFKFILPADLFAILWLMIIMNAINWLDGIDGLSTGITVIMSATLAILSLRVGNVQAAILAVILCAACLGYLPYNFPPAKNTLAGSLGANLYGLMLGILTILGPVKSAGSVIILAVPVLDMLVVLLGRVFLYNVTNPLKLLQISDKTHLHHRLLALGLTPRQIILIIYVMVGLVCSLALYISGSNLAYIVFAVLGILGGLTLGIRLYYHQKVIRYSKIPSHDYIHKLKNILDEKSNTGWFYKSNRAIGFFTIAGSDTLTIVNEKVENRDVRKILEIITSKLRESKIYQFKINSELPENIYHEYLLSHGYIFENNFYKDLYAK